MKTLVFRPQSYSRLWLLHERRFNGYTATKKINYRPRTGVALKEWTAHQVQFAKRFGNLHYLACHSPTPIRMRWQSAYSNFMARHFGSRGTASNRFINKHTCHSWL